MICPNCKTKIGYPDANFCHICGQPLRGDKISPSPALSVPQTPKIRCGLIPAVLTALFFFPVGCIAIIHALRAAEFLSVNLLLPAQKAAELARKYAVIALAAGGIFWCLVFVLFCH